MEDFQITKEQYDSLDSRLGALEGHRHSGIDSLQVKPSDLLQASLYFAVAKITLTSTQIKLLKTTPIAIVPAMGTNSVIIVETIDAKIAFNTVAYTGANNLEFRYTNGSGAKVTADMASTFLDSAATAYDHVAGVTVELTPVANAAIVVAVPTADPGAGNSPITFITKYRVVTF